MSTISNLHVLLILVYLHSLKSQVGLVQNVNSFQPRGWRTHSNCISVINCHWGAIRQLLGNFDKLLLFIEDTAG